MGTEYTRSEINAAATEALKLASQHKTLGKDKYPHAYNDYERFNFSHGTTKANSCYTSNTTNLHQAQKPYLEFPILSDGQVYNGGQPDTDRVVIGSISEDFESAVYCAVITHKGEKNNQFQMCKDDTMNVRGSGDEPGQGAAGDEQEGSGKEKHHHRHGKKLIDRIDL